MYRVLDCLPVYFRRVKASRKRGFPWLPLVLLALSVYVFWILPRQFPPRNVQVEFSPSGSSKGLRTVKTPEKAAGDSAPNTAHSKN